MPEAIKRLFRRFLARLDRQEIGDGKGDVFFWRYTAFKCRRFAVYLHEFLRSDAGRCLHDHPWPFVAVILRGGYHEEMPDGRHWRRPGSILFRRAEASHRIEIEPGSRPWSLVIVGRKVRPWGFYTPEGWRPWMPNYSPICETGDLTAKEAHREDPP